jgi:hypothetical protein
MPKNLLNDEELKQLVSGSEYLSGALRGGCQWMFDDGRS